MNATYFVFGIIMAVITFAVGQVAYEITMTVNPQNLGGLLICAFFTLSPVAFFVLGYYFPSAEYEDDFEHIVMEGDTYYRR